MAFLMADSRTREGSYVTSAFSVARLTATVATPSSFPTTFSIERHAGGARHAFDGDQRPAWPPPCVPTRSRRLPRPSSPRRRIQGLRHTRGAASPWRDSRSPIRPRPACPRPSPRGRSRMRRSFRSPSALQVSSGTPCNPSPPGEGLQFEYRPFGLRSSRVSKKDSGARGVVFDVGPLIPYFALCKICS